MIFTHKAHYILHFFVARGKNEKNRNLAGFTTGFGKKKMCTNHVILHICETTKPFLANL